MLDIKRLKEIGVRFSIKDLIYEEFLNISTKEFESAKTQEQAHIYLDALEETFNDEQKFLFDRGIDLLCNFWSEKEEELLEFVFVTLSTFYQANPII